MALFALFFWSTFFFLLISYLYLKFLREEIDRNDFLLSYTVSLSLLISGLIIFFNIGI